MVARRALAARASQMRLAVVLAGPDSAASDESGRIAQAVAAGLGTTIATRRLGAGAHELKVETHRSVELAAALRTAIAGLPVDVCVQSRERRRKRLLVADMDSTIIDCECVDELADFAGVQAEVAEITERAMRGEMAFEPALRQRVSLLKGLSLAELERCYEERVRLNSGARTLARTMAANGARCVLVSGGFGFFAQRVALSAGFHAHYSNELLYDGSHLAGEVAEPVLGREAKLRALLREAEAQGVALEETLAIGDGANDLSMIEAAGLGVAYRAKPIMAERADARLDHADLTALLYFQGYTEAEFARG